MMRQCNSSRKPKNAAASTWQESYAPLASWPNGTDNTARQAAGIAMALFVMLGLLFMMASAPPALSQGVQLVKVDVSVVGKGFRASKLIGETVVNDKNEKIGKVDDIIIDNNNVMFAVLQVGGFLGLGSKLVAVPFNSLKIEDSGKKVVLPGASKDELTKLADFKYLG
jgi:sporulation protein YlmC with PRC-barrel domain